MRATPTWKNFEVTTQGQVGVAVLRGYTAQFLEWGEGNPLVLIPGLAGGLELVSPLAAQLASHYKVYSYTLRGEENCFALRHRFDVNDLVSDLAEFLDLLRLERPIVMGLSFGGLIAAQLAARLPSRLGALVVAGLDVRFQPSLLRTVTSQVLSHYQLPANSKFVNQFFNLLFGGRFQDHPAFDYITQACWQTDQSVIAHRFRIAEEVDLTSALRAIKAPTLVLKGDKDLLVTDRGVKQMADQIADCTVRPIFGGGHLAFVTHVEEIVKQVTSFVQPAATIMV